MRLALPEPPQAHVGGPGPPAASSRPGVHGRASHPVPSVFRSGSQTFKIGVSAHLLFLKGTRHFRPFGLWGGLFPALSWRPFEGLPSTRGKGCAGGVQGWDDGAQYDLGTDPAVIGVNPFGCGCLEGPFNPC